MERILIVDDSARDRRLARDALEGEGYIVDEADGGAEGIRLLFEQRPQVVILDIVMPQMDGWDTCRRIREMTDVPVIMLTSLDQEDEMVRGLDLGADDFVSKPISPKHLIARVRAVLRRARTPETSRSDFRYDDGRLAIDVAQHAVRLDDASLDLSPTEFRLLVALAEAPGRVHSYSSLLKQIWGPEYVDDIDFLRVYIWRLRKKLEADPDKPARILTERGFGYRFVAP